MDAGIASVVAVQPDETRIEIGLIGREGMTGTAVALGGDQSPHSTYMQVAGEGQQIAAKDLRKAMDASVPLRNLLLKFVQVAGDKHGSIARAMATRAGFATWAMRSWKTAMALPSAVK